MNRNEIVFIHGGEREQEGFTLFCIAGEPYDVMRLFINNCYRVKLFHIVFLLWKIKKTPKRHMKEYKLYLGAVGHKRFFDANFKEMV